MIRDMFKGDIFYIRNRNARGYEIKKGRPGIIVSNDLNNSHSGAVEVVLLTTADKKEMPTHVEIWSAPKPSIALCEQVTTVTKEYVGDYIGAVTQQELNNIERALLIGFDIQSNVKGNKQLEAWIKKLEDQEEEIQKTGRVAQEEVSHPESSTCFVGFDIESDPRFVKVMAERDVFKELYLDAIGKR